MAKYDISHPQLPQLRGTLELPEGEQPNETHFWEAAKTMVRPYGASGLTDEAKIIAYRNGFFDAPDMAILDQEDDPDTIQDEEAPGLLSSLWDMSKEGVQRFAKGTSPHEKVFYLGTKLDPYNREMVSQDYSTDKFSEQLREAGKLTFGNLSNMEIIYKLDDVVGRSLRQVGLKPTKSNRAKAIRAARDYSEGNIKASVGQGVVRAMYTSSYVAEGVPYLMNKILTDDADDGDVLDAANSAISFDKLNYEVENADKLAAFVADNKIETLKMATSGIVGGVTPILEREDIYGVVGSPESLEVDSPMLEDLRSGYQEPSEGLSFLTEVVADPLNLAGASAAKGVTAPMRIGLKGRMLKTIKGVEKNTTRLAQLQAALKKLPEDALVRGRIEGQAVKVAEELAEQQKILQKYGSNSLLLRLAGKASPETLGKVAMETFDQSTDAGKVGMGLVREATKATDEMSKLRRVANVAAKYNPEIAGATVGAMIAGPGGAIAGAALPSLIKVARVLSAMPENMAIRAIITASQNAGEEITEQAARQRYRSWKNMLGGTLGMGSAVGFAVDQDSLGGGAGIAALTAFLGPKTLSLVDNVARDARVIGSELTLARTGDHTPFFRRLAMLPTPDEGLIGANTDKFNILMRAGPEGFFGRAKDVAVQGSKASVREAFPSPQAFRRGPQGEAIGRAPTISGATQKFANFLDKPGVVGRLGTPIESLGRFGKGMAAGASIPATIGFIASGGQAGGAIAGAIMSAPFTALGSGAGMYQNYKTKGDLYAKQIGDVQYYREHLTKPERAEFDALPANIRAEIAGYSLSHPDVVFKQTAEGEGGFDPVNMEVSYNPDGTGFLKGTMAHEITHFMEIHGLTPMVNRILFGDELTRTPGEFASYDSDGKIVYTDEFIKLRDIYMDKVRKDTSLNSQEAIDAVTAYESDPKKIGREIFADQGADYLLSGKREKALNQGPLGKLVGATIDGITGVSFLRDFLLKLNLPLNSEGKFIKSTGLFDGKLRKIPELQNLIEKYYKDVRGLKKAQIEGEKVADPLTKRTREKKGARPIDDEFDTLYTVEDQKDPNVVDKLDTGGIFKTNPKTGKIEKDSLKKPIRMTKGEADEISQAAGDHAAKVFEKNGIEVEINDEGRPFVKDLGALNEDIIDQLAKGPIHPRQIAALREISRALRQGDGERAGMLIGYYAATQGRKPKAVPFAVRTTMPYGFELTAQGNILVRLHDTQQIQRNLKFLKGQLQAKKLPDELIGMYDDLFGNDNAVWDAFATYRNNTSNGIDGRTGLDTDPVKADKKLNFLNALHGGIDKAHVAKNPVLSSIGWKMAGINQKRSPFGPATKTFRLDRIFDAKRSGTASGFNLERAKDLMSPQGQKLMMPQMELDFSPPKAAQSSEAKPNFWKIYRIDPKGPKVYDEVADVLIQVGSPWMDGSIIESKAPILRLEKGKLRQAMNRAHRRADRGGGKQFMPAAYHGTPHTFKAEDGAPLGKFKTSQIGTGEGAQAYGHGLYFAGKREVAEHYRKTLARDENPNKWKEKPGAESFDEEVNFILDDAAIMSKTNAEFLKDLEALETQATSGKYEYSPVEVFHIKKAVSLVKSGDVELAKGSLYKVELAPKENEYLLWDKPLSEQPKGVKEKLKKMGESDPERMRFFKATILEEYTTAKGNAVKPGSHTGEDIYRALAGRGNPSESQWQGASAALKEAGIPGIKYLDGDSRGKGKGDYNYVIFDEADVTITEKQFMPASEAGASKGKGNRGTFDAGEGNILFMPQANAVMAKAGDTVKLPQDSLRLFIPASPEVNLADYANRKIFALTTDRLGIGQMATGPKGKKKPIGKEAQGGRGFTQIYNGGGWAFSTKDAADRFITRVKQVAGKDDSALVGLTALADVNHLKSQYGQLAYANALRAAVETGVLPQSKVDAHLLSIMERILESKAKKAPKGENRRTLESIKTLSDFEQAVKSKKLNFAMADLFYNKAKQKTLPISKAEALEFGLDLETIAKDIADPELADLEGFGQVVGLLEIFKDQQPVKNDFHYSYPYVVEGKRIGFLKEFMDVGQLSSNPKIRDKSGKVSAQPLQTVMPEFDRLKSMQFMPSDPKAPKRQPVNRVQPQAQSMPSNRFMAPASAAKGELSERFR